VLLEQRNKLYLKKEKRAKELSDV